MKLPKLRIRKDGKPFKQDLERAKKELKENFAFYQSFQGENLPPALRGTYNRIAKAKEQAANRIKNPETGRFLNHRQESIIKAELKSFAKDTGRSFEDLVRKPDIINTVYQQAIKRKSESMVPVDVAKDMAKEAIIQKVLIFRNPDYTPFQVKVSKAVELITRAAKEAIRASGGFDPVCRVTLSKLKTEIQIFVPDFTGLNDEEINHLLEDLKNEGLYEVKRSDPKAKKQRREKRKTKKPNKSSTGKKRN